MSLTKARAAIDAKDRRNALEALLEAWRASRSTAIADVIDVVSSDITRSLPKIEGKSRAAFQSSWLEVASRDDAADVGRLLDVLDAEPCTLMRDRIDRLALRPHDPRLARALTAFIARNPCACTSTPNAPMWTQIFKLITTLGDVRGRPALTAHATKKRPGVFFKVIRARASKALEAMTEPSRLSSEDAALVNEIAAKAAALLAGPPPSGAAKPLVPSTDKRTEAELLELVYDAPDDDAPRLVYADFLAERGDTRGELIVLQCKKNKTPLNAAETKRERSLLREHGRRALGALEPAIAKDNLVYERGFVAACELEFKSDTQRMQLLRHRAWSTVQRMVAPEAALLSVPSLMPSLREVAHVHPELVRQLADQKVALRAVTSAAFTVREGEQLDCASVRSVFPMLERATVRLTPLTRNAYVPMQLKPLRWIALGPWPKSLEQLTVSGVTRDDQLPKLAEWLPLVPATVKTFVFDLLVDWRIAATRSGKRGEGWQVTAEQLAHFARSHTRESVVKGLDEQVTTTVLPMPKKK